MDQSRSRSKSKANWSFCQPIGNGRISEKLDPMSKSILPIQRPSFTVGEDGGSVGVNYGRIAGDLPSASKVVKLLKSQGIDRVKVYDTDPAVLRSLAGTGIKVTVNLPNEFLYAAARRRSFAYGWVRRNVVAYYPRTQIEAIAVGNEVFVDPKNTTGFLIPAMKNIHQAIVKYNLHSDIKLSSPVALSALQNSYPSSAGSFRPELIEPVFKPMLEFLRETGSYLMVNAYPFFAYESNSDVISLDYSLFRRNPGVPDAGNGLRYFNLFDAQIDAVFAAMSALKYDDVPLVISETGWPSKGDENEVGASIENAAAYNGNLIKRILTGGGTPLRPKANLTVFLFALFNENKKTGPTSERNYGLFYPNMEKVYDIPFTVEDLKNFRDESSPVTGDGDGGKVGVSDPVKKGGKVNVSGVGSWCVARDVGKESCSRVWIMRVVKEVLIAVRYNLGPRVTILTRYRHTLRLRSIVITRRWDAQRDRVILVVQPT
ncbi:hypothetical protein OSB04_030429 [Centaurea solstitialis]|uniref:glucan endo-1,3-beta-D-glucosidase n=1 Tax=Centaurea solstitialis TaxID=347529 RepID=A0AA38W753_9ASTR|nr:hypothetical protein OSB04_030429 [Centaurea solstitialis]